MTASRRQAGGGERRGEGLLIEVMVEHRGAAGDDELRLGMQRAELDEGLQDARGVLALLHPADAEHDGAVAEAEAGFERLFAPVRNRREAGGVDAIADDGRFQREHLGEQVLPQAADDEMPVGLDDGAALEREQLRIAEGVDMVDGAGEAGDRARAASASPAHCRRCRPAHGRRRTRGSTGSAK